VAAWPHSNNISGKKVPRNHTKRKTTRQTEKHGESCFKSRTQHKHIIFTAAVSEEARLSEEASLSEEARLSEASLSEETHLTVVTGAESQEIQKDLMVSQGETHTPSLQQ
jgi:hypothetical protein